MKYKVVLDTEAIWNSSESGLDQVFSKHIGDIKAFLDEHGAEDVQLCLSEMVVEERIQQKEEEAKQVISEVNEGLRRLKVLGYPNPALDDTGIQPAAFREFAEKYIKKYLVEVLPTPKLDPKELVSRAIKKLKPFNDKGAGFKDTVILLSMIDDAQKTEGYEYILVSNNKRDFTAEVASSFLAVTNKKLHIVHDIEGLKSLLDAEIPLGLHLKKLHQEIKEAVGKKVGTITLELNKAMVQKQDDPFSLMGLTKYRAPTAYTALRLYNERATTPDESQITGYDFASLSIENISQSGTDNFQVSGKITAKIHYDNKEKEQPVFTVSSIYAGYPGSEYLPDFKTFGFVLFYAKTTDDISTISFIPNFF
jgi:hypothetical protein